MIFKLHDLNFFFFLRKKNHSFLLQVNAFLYRILHKSYIISIVKLSVTN